ncbi:MAG: molybdenum cofactor guanylyltransferase [Chloroflexi bacterium]|nr:molybdenum cofactor guanylyltransferase [Chloroflexota bacterium]MBI3339980.1 molybdenum cofactor guanylyltransferase [Chloroflexota bacterium]
MLSIVVQAGGQSTRMGENKALKPFLGKPLIQRVVTRLAPIADEILVTTNQPADFAFLGLPLFPDLKPGRGPLGGLYTALVSAQNPVVAVVACDMPFVNAELLEAAASLLVTEEADVVIAKTPEGFEPLHAVYRREACIQAIEAAIAQDQWRMVSWFPAVNVRVLTLDEVDRYDPARLAFWNVNTPEDFTEAEQRARSSE